MDWHTRFRLHGLLAWLPIFALLSIIVFLVVAGADTSYDQPFMRLVLSFIFSTLVSLFMAYLVARTFMVRGRFGLLLFGCGVLLWGLGGFASSIASNVDPDLGVAVHNICVCLSALCHLIGVGLSIRPRGAVGAGIALAAAYAVTVSIVLVVLSAVLAGWVPAFFVQGKGGTPLRYWVLGAAIAMFLLTAVILRLTNRTRLSTFAHWYSLGLVLTAVGLFGVMMQTAVGNPMNWAGRVTQYLGGIYMLVSAWASARQTRHWGIPLEAALSDARQQYEELFALAADGIVVHEAFSDISLGTFTEANPAICALLGYSLDEMHALGPKEITARDERPAVPVDALLTGDEQVLRYERTLVAKDGRRIPVEISTRFFMRQGRPFVMSVIRDITERKQAEDKIRRLYREAQSEIERRRTLELRLRRANDDSQEFTSAIAHDLQSPLCGVIAVAELMTTEFGGRLGHDMDMYISQITGGLGRLRHMILDLLDYSRLGHDDTKQDALIDLGEVMEHVRLNLETRIQEAGAVITHDVLPQLEGNFARIVELFQNLIENAIKYRGKESPRIHISADSKGSDCIFCIADNGIGIDPKHAEDVFGVFRRLHGTQYEGTGIGLSLCKKIVETMGGRIWVESNLGSGTRFCFLIPMRSGFKRADEYQDQEAGHQEKKEQISDSTCSSFQEQAVRSGQFTVLVVEDEDQLRFAIANTLRRKGLTVLEAGDGSVALDSIRADVRIDILLLDIVLPGASSREVFEHAKRLRPGITVIATSSHGEEMAATTLAGKAEYFIPKPYRLDEVAHLVQTIPLVRSQAIA